MTPETALPMLMGFGMAALILRWMIGVALGERPRPEFDEDRSERTPGDWR